MPRLRLDTFKVTSIARMTRMALSTQDAALLEVMRDRCLERLTIEQVSWAVQKLTRAQKQGLVQSVGLQLNPKHLKSGVGPLVHARLDQVAPSNRWGVAWLLRTRCLEEFASVLGAAFE